MTVKFEIAVDKNGYVVNVIKDGETIHYQRNAMKDNGWSPTVALRSSLNDDEEALQIVIEEMCVNARCVLDFLREKEDKP